MLRMLTVLAMELNPSRSTSCRPRYASHAAKYDIRAHSSQGVSADASYQLIRDELSLDGSPALNLASFVHTWMPKQADQLMMENISKNLIDQDEYPMTRESALHG